MDTVERFVKVYSFPEQYTEVLKWQQIIEEELMIFNDIMKPTTSMVPSETRSSIDTFMEEIRLNTVYHYQTLKRLRPILNKNNIELTSYIFKSTEANYRDVIGINRSFMYGEKKYLTEVLGKSWNLYLYLLVLTDVKGMYYGSVWSFFNPNFSYIGMYGIKGSLIDVITRKTLSEYGRVSRMMIEKIEELGLSLGANEIIVLNPLPGMRPILERYDFIEYEDDDDDSPVRQFMTPISNSYEFWARDIV